MYPTKILLFFEFPHQRGPFEQSFALFGGKFCPKIAVVVGGCDPRGKSRIAVEGRGGVVRATGLALVAPEDPTVGVEPLRRGDLYGAIGDAKCRIDAPIGTNCARWAS